MSLQSRKNLDLIRKAAFAAYVIVLVYFTIFAESMGRTPGGAETGLPGYNLVLFREISRFWTYREQLGTEAVLLNIFGNIAMFIPLGYLLPRITDRCSSFPDTLLAGFLISFIIECTQYICCVGSFDVDDLLLNTLGAAAGCLLSMAVEYCARKRNEKLSEERCIHIREVIFLDTERRESA